jgi:hypothetical protein
MRPPLFVSAVAPKDWHPGGNVIDTTCECLHLGVRREQAIVLVKWNDVRPTLAPQRAPRGK